MDDGSGNEMAKFYLIDSTKKRPQCMFYCACGHAIEEHLRQRRKERGDALHSACLISIIKQTQLLFRTKKKLPTCVDIRRLILVEETVITWVHFVHTYI